MTNVSKKKLDAKVQDQLFKQFAQLFTSEDEKYVGNLFDALFTDSEKIMFVKRIAVILLLAENYSSYRIAKTLKVSEATVYAAKKRFDAGTYDCIVSVTRKKSFDKEKFWMTFELLVRAGLPPQGKGRWKWLYENTKDM